MKTNNNYVTRKTVRKGKAFLAVMAVLLICALFFSGCGSKASAGMKEVNAETIKPNIIETPKANVIEPPKGPEKQPATVQKAHVNQQKKVCDNPYCDDWDCDDVVCDDDVYDYYEDQYEDRYDLDDRYDRYD